MLSLPSVLSQSTPSLTFSETDSLYIAVATLHHELKTCTPQPCGVIDGGGGGSGGGGKGVAGPKFTAGEYNTYLNL